MARGNKETPFSAKTFQKTKVIDFQSSILDSEKSLPNLRKEIRRVFQQANRRIQNLQKSNVLSPALTGLNITNTEKFSQFAMTGKTWSELKIEYSKAISFLKKPTSTITGAKEYETHIKRELNLSDKEFNLAKMKLQGAFIASKRDNIFAEYLLRYKDFSGDFEHSARDVADQIESDAQQLNGINNWSEPLTQDVNSMLQGTHSIEEIEKINNNFDRFDI